MEFRFEHLFDSCVMLAGCLEECRGDAVRPLPSASPVVRRSTRPSDATAGSSTRPVILAATPGCLPNGGVTTMGGKAESCTPSTSPMGAAD